MHFCLLQTIAAQQCLQADELRKVREELEEKTAPPSPPEVENLKLPTETKEELEVLEESLSAGRAGSFGIRIKQVGRTSPSDAVTSAWHRIGSPQALQHLNWLGRARRDRPRKLGVSKLCVTEILLTAKYY